MSRMFDPAELRRMGEAVARAQDALASSSGLEAARLAEQLAGGSTIRALQSAVDKLSALRLPDMFPAATALTDLASRTLAVHDSTAEVARQLGGSRSFGRVVDDVVATQHAMGQQLADMARAFDVSATVRQFTTAADVASRLLGPLNLGASPLIRLAEDAAQAYGRMAGLGRLPRELEQFRPIIQQHAAAVSIAPDEASRRLTTDEAIRAMFEVVTGIETNPGTTPEQRFKFWFSILWALWVVLWSAHAAQRRELDESLQEAARAATARLQAQTVARLTETIVRLEARLAVQEVPEVLVRIARRSSLREAPSGSTRRMARVEAGQHAILITRFLRWDYVELVGADGVRTGIVGWIHHRRVRTPRVD